jgi:MOSC domain-containing protein YiiM
LIIVLEASATNDLVMHGIVVAVASDAGHRFSKPVRDSITMIEGHGVEGDAHAGPFVRHRYLARRRPSLPNLRQVHVIRSELFGELRALGYDVDPGDLGENVTTSGLDLERLPLGTLLSLGASAVIELTGLRTPCVLIDRYRAGLQSRMIDAASTGPRFRCGVLGVVKADGLVVAGDNVAATVPQKPWRLRPAL